MSKIFIEVSEKEYCLELNRKEISRSEDLGLKVRDFENSPAKQSYQLFRCGLHLNHPNLKGYECDELFDAYSNEGGDTNEIMELLLEQYASFFSTTQADTTKVKKARVEK